MKASRVSAVVVTLNEEAHIRDCLESLAWCAERILVDMESQDRTRELAERLATKIILQAPIPHMEFARNRGIDAATGEWILVVDADETIPAVLADRLHAWAAAASKASGLWIPRMAYCFGRPVPHVGGFPDYQLRFFRRGAGRYPDRLHSAPVIEGRAEFFPTEEGVWIRHLRKNAAITDLVRKWDTYAQKEAETLRKEGAHFGGPQLAIWTLISVFRFRYVTLKGYRDGMAGFVLSVLFAFYRFEVEAKLWELEGHRGDWDCDVGRLRSLPRIVLALVVGAGRRLGRRARRGSSETPRTDRC